MKVSNETIEAILSHVEINKLKDIYRRTLPLVGMRRLLFEKFLRNDIALTHATLLEQTFNLPFHIKDTNHDVLATVFNMYLIETSPMNPQYHDFDWEDFKRTTLKRMKILRSGLDIKKIQRNLKGTSRKIYRWK